MYEHHLKISRILTLALLAVACAPFDATARQEEPPTQATVATEAEEPSEDDVLEKLVAQAKADLAERLSVEEYAIEVVTADRVTWRDSSLGCPKPGMMYMQSLQDGARIILRADGEKYAYHSTLEGPPFYCEKPSRKGYLSDPLSTARSAPE